MVELKQNIYAAKLNAVSVEYEMLNDDRKAFMTATEWVNGEGVDVEILFGSKKTNFSLCIEDVEALLSALETIKFSERIKPLEKI